MPSTSQRRVGERFLHFGVVSPTVQHEPKVEDTVEDVNDHYGDPGDRLTRAVYDAVRQLYTKQRREEVALVCNTLCIQDTSFDDLLKDCALTKLCNTAIEQMVLRDPIKEGHVWTAQDQLCIRLGCKAKRPYYKPHWVT